MPVPATLEELLDPVWLTGALAPRYPGAKVTRVLPRESPASRISTNALFSIELAAPAPEGLPADLCAKGYFAESAQPYAFLGQLEARFYRDVADHLGILTLPHVYADVDPVTRAGVIITEERAGSSTSGPTSRARTRWCTPTAALGSPVPATADEAWDDYRTGIVYGLYMWGITTLETHEVISNRIERLSAAAAFHHSYELLGV